VSIDLINQFLVFSGKKITSRFFQTKVFGHQTGGMMGKVILFGPLETNLDFHLLQIAFFYLYTEF
jgi:hypothetical protein